jgi:hypothetical protein
MILPDEQPIAKFVADLANREEVVGLYSAGNHSRLTPL